jgi:hypothetical protein
VLLFGSSLCLFGCDCCLAHSQEAVAATKQVQALAMAQLRAAKQTADTSATERARIEPEVAAAACTLKASKKERNVGVVFTECFRSLLVRCACLRATGLTSSSWRQRDWQERCNRDATTSAAS